MSPIFDEGEELKVREIVRLTLDEANLPEARASAIAQHAATCPTAKKVDRMCWTVAGAVAIVLVLYRVAVALMAS